MKDILEFQGDFRWLSNFAKVSIKLDGITFSSVEHAYMSAKSSDPDWKLRCSDSNNTPGQIKRMSRNVKLIPGWDKKKFLVMENLIDQKFDQEPFRSNLITTGDCLIQEGNKWGDKIWGVDLYTGIGQNILGKMIMKKRSKLKGE